LQKKKYLCPNDINQFSSYKYYASALSAILVKPYYTDISTIDINMPIGNDLAVSPKKQVNNPCLQKSKEN